MSRNVFDTVPCDHEHQSPRTLHIHDCIHGASVCNSNLYDSPFPIRMTYLSDYVSGSGDDNNSGVDDANAFLTIDKVCVLAIDMFFTPKVVSTVSLSGEIDVVIIVSQSYSQFDGLMTTQFPTMNSVSIRASSDYPVIDLSNCSSQGCLIFSSVNVSGSEHRSTENNSL